MSSWGLMNWLTSFFKVGSSCLVVLACFAYVCYVLFDLIITIKGHYQLMEWQYYFFAACAFAVGSFGAWALLFNF